MRIIDITGPVYTGMWNYSEPLGSLLGDFRLSELNFEFGGEKYSLGVFNGFKAQTGTYLESPGQYIEDNKYKISDIPIEKLFMMEAHVLKIPYETLGEKDGKKFVSMKDIKKFEKENISEGRAIVIGTGYGKFWNKTDFFHESWFFKMDAMEYLISKKPFLLAADSAEWENPKNPEGIFKKFYHANILILAPCINIEEIEGSIVKLTVFPLKILNSYICPVRALITEQ